MCGRFGSRWSSVFCRDVLLGGSWIVAHWMSHRVFCLETGKTSGMLIEVPLELLVWTAKWRQDCEILFE